MKKLLGFITLMGVAATPLSLVTSCNKSSAENEENTFEAQNGVSELNISNGQEGKVTISDYPSFADCDIQITTEGSTFNPNASSDSDQVPFEANGPNDDGVITFTGKGLGKGKAKISASRNGKSVGEFSIKVNSIPKFNFANNPSDIKFLADENGKFPNTKSDNYKKNEIILNNYGELKNLYDIKYSITKKYSDGQSPFKSDDENSKEVTKNSIFKESDDSKTAFLDLTMIKQSGTSIFSLSATLKEEYKQKATDFFSDISSFENLKVDNLNIVAVGHGKEVIDDEGAKISPNNDSTTGNIGNFNNVNLSKKKTYNTTIESNSTIGDYCTVAMLVPTSLFSGEKYTNIGVSATQVKAHSLSKKSSIVVYSKNDVNILSDNNNIKIEKDNSDSKKWNISTSVEVNSATLTIKSGKFEQEVKYSCDNNGEETEYSEAVAPLVDLSNAKSEVSTITIPDSNTWDLSKTTYVNLSVLSGLMNNESEYYTFYKQVKAGDNFNFDMIISGKADENPNKTKFLTAVLSGKFDMSKLISSQGSGDGSSISTYQQFIDSIANLYFTTVDTK